MLIYSWAGRVRKPPVRAASLPESARLLLQPFRKDSLDLKVGAHEELSYRVSMRAGATLVYAWWTGSSAGLLIGRGGEMLVCESPGQPALRRADARGAFEAQSSGWYRWNWKNQNSKPVMIHLKLDGYYEPAIIPATSMPYDR